MGTLRSMKSYVRTVLSGSFLEEQTSHIESHTQLRHSFCSRMLMTFALVFVMIGLPQAASAADCPTEINAEDCGCTISSAGRYRLNVECPVDSDDGLGIDITASNVYLNLRGHTIRGPGCSLDPEEPSLIGIAVAGSDVHITNGTVTALSIGIQVIGNSGVPVEHNHLSNLTLTENCIGLNIRDANDNHVNGSNISANIITGVSLQNANHNVIDSNEINDNDPPGGGVAGAGLSLGNSDDNTILSNEFSGNGVFFNPEGGGSHNTIRGNTVKDAGGAGIDVRDNNNTIQSNRLTGNGSGIQLLHTFPTSGNFLYHNRALGNGIDLRDTDCINNTWTNNIFETDDEMGSGAGPRAGCIR